MLTWEQQCQIWREQDAQEEAARRTQDAEKERALAELIAKQERELAVRIARQECNNAAHDECPICEGSGYVEHYIDVDQTHAAKCLTCNGEGKFDEDCPGCELCDRRAEEMIREWKAEEDLADYLIAVPLWAGEPVVQESAMERARRRAPGKPAQTQFEPEFTVMKTFEQRKGA